MEISPSVVSLLSFYVAFPCIPERSHCFFFFSLHEGVRVYSCILLTLITPGLGIAALAGKV